MKSGKVGGKSHAAQESSFGPISTEEAQGSGAKKRRKVSSNGVAVPSLKVNSMGKKNWSGTSGAGDGEGSC